MAAIDFPPNPQNGDTFTPPGLDVTYTYQSNAWTGVVTSPDIYLKLTGGNMGGDVTFATDKILLSATGNANFVGNVTAANITSVSNALTAIKAAASDSSTDLAGLKSAIASALSSF